MPFYSNLEEKSVNWLNDRLPGSNCLDSLNLNAFCAISLAVWNCLGTLWLTHLRVWQIHSFLIPFYTLMSLATYHIQLTKITHLNGGIADPGKDFYFWYKINIIYDIIIYQPVLAKTVSQYLRLSASLPGTILMFNQVSSEEEGLVSAAQCS